MYQAFICCGHKDRRVGERLRRALMRHRKPSKLGKIYLDIVSEDAGKTAADDRASAALLRSEWLIVICSPETGRSDVVNQRVLDFRRSGAGAKLLCLIASGQPGGHDMKGLEHRECLPEAARPLADLHHRPASARLTGTEGRIVADIRIGHGDWPGAVRSILSAITGMETDDLRTAERRRAFRRGLSFAGLGGIALGALAMVLMTGREIEATRQIDTMRAQALSAHQALDRGDLRAALAAFEGESAEPARGARGVGLPPEAISALTRLTFDTRLLAQIAAPVANAKVLRLLPTGVLAAVESAGRTHLIDLGTGDIATVYDPEHPTFTRISRDGLTVWTAHFKPAQRDASGQTFAPLLFEEAELATGTVRLATAVQSVPPDGGSGEISPDGRLFAVDLGPGAGDKTVVGVFHREAQALAGVLTLPSDKAEVQFVGPEHLLVRIDPPNEWPGAPGLYLWKVGEERARTLRMPGIAPACPGTASRPDLPGAVVSLSPDRTELALALADRDGGGCILRWALPGGGEKALLKLDQHAVGLTLLASDGPYLVQDGAGNATLLGDGPAAEAISVAGCPLPLRAHLFRNADDGAAAMMLCHAPDGTGAIYQRGDIMVWQGMIHPGGITALTYDADLRRLFTAGADGMLRIWDMTPRFRALPGGTGVILLAALLGGDVLMTGPEAVLRVGPTGTPTGAPIPTGGNAVQVLPMGGRLVGVLSGEGFSIHDQIADDGTDPGRVAPVVVRFPDIRTEGVGNISASPSGRRFMAIDTMGRALWGDGMTGALLARIELGGPRPIIAGAAGDRSFAVLATAPGPADGSRRAQYLYAGSDTATAGLVSEWQGRAARLRLSPVGDRALVLIDRAPPARAELTLVDLKSGAEKLVSSFLSGPHEFGFSPEGSRIFLTAPSDSEAMDAAGQPFSGMLIARAEDGSPQRTLVQSDPAARPVWSADAGLVAAPGAGIHAVDTGQRLCPNLIGTTAHNFAFDPTGARIAFQPRRADAGARLVVADIRTCTRLTGARIDLSGAAPLFASTDTLWLPLQNGVSILPFGLDPVRMHRAAVERSRSLSMWAQP